LTSTRLQKLAADRESRTVRLRPADGGRISALAWSPDGGRLAAESMLGALDVRSLETGVRMGVPSPCIDVCRIDGRMHYCTGCLRTVEEIRRWRKL
jgi:hypothetical protein